MSEAEVILKTSSPCTRSSLATDLRQLGLTPGSIVLVHASLSSLGWVCGGSVTVIQALMDVLTTEGTLIMPTQSMNYSDPAEWEDPPVPREWWSIIRETMPAFDARITPTSGMGRIAEVFRTWPNVLRSSHPTVSFTAWGKHKKVIVENHSLDNSLGKESPLARLYDLNAWVLLLGVGYDRNTCFHLAEYQNIGGAKQVQKGAPILEAEQRIWKQYSDIEFDTDNFAEIGIAFEQQGHVRLSQIGKAETRLFALRYAVDFARNQK